MTDTASGTPSPAAVASASARILVVEDESIVAIDLSTSLQRLGYTVTDVAGTGKAALASLERQPPDLLLVDIRLRGEMDGIAVAEEVGRRYGLPVVYLTAYSDEATLRRAKITSPSAYLLKPFDERELHIVVDMALFRHRAQREYEKLLQERAARAAVERQHQWAQFLVEASAQLASSLDVRVTLDAITRLAVPYLADLAAIHLKEEQGIKTVAITDVGGQEDHLWQLLRQYPPPLEQPHGFPRVIRTGQAELLPNVDEDILARVAQDDTHRELLRSLHLRAEICVPLMIRGSAFGALTLLITRSGRSYNLEDVERATELAQRCSTAIDNARLYQTAQDAIAARDEFLSVAAHELRTPVSALLLTLHTLSRSSRRQPAERLQSKMRGIMKQGEDLAQLVERLLDVSRVRTGQLELGIEQFDLAQLVRDIVARYQERASRVQSALTVDVPREVQGAWDRLRLEQVLTNLLDNAMKFAGGKPIAVRLESDDERVCLMVRDQGIGIHPDKVPYIFERFERGVSARHFGGLGLGLYVVRRVVQAHHGEITVDTAVGEGATFSVHLPRWTNGRPETS